MRFTYKIVNSGQGTNSVSFQGFGLKINAGFPGVKKTTDGCKSAFFDPSQTKALGSRFYNKHFGAPGFQTRSPPPSPPFRILSSSQARSQALFSSCHAREGREEERP